MGVIVPVTDVKRPNVPLCETLVPSCTEHLLPGSAETRAYGGLGVGSSPARAIARGPVSALPRRRRAYRPRTEFHTLLGRSPQWSRRATTRERDSVYSRLFDATPPTVRDCVNDFDTAKLRRGVPGAPATRSNARRLQIIATYSISSALRPPG
jgi:hypothetical protein